MSIATAFSYSSEFAAPIYGWSHYILSSLVAEPKLSGYPLGFSSPPCSLLILLTAAERRVAELIPTGMANKGIADELGLSIETAKFHVSNSLIKLGLANRTQLAVTAYKATAPRQLLTSAH